MAECRRAMLLLISAFSIQCLLSAPTCRADAVDFDAGLVGTTAAGVPEIIWSFWSDPATLPKTVELAQASWRFFAPAYTIHMLHAGNWREFMTEADVHQGGGAGENITATTPDNRFADWLRTVLLARHGGVWMDASLLLTAPLELLINQSAQLSGVHLSGMLFETSFIVSARNSTLMQRWREEFQKICPMNEREYDAYLLELTNQGIEALNGQFRTCYWEHTSRVHAVVHWIFMKIVWVINSIGNVLGFHLHPCGERFWKRYLNLHVALNSVIRTDGTDPRPLWDKYGISAQNSEETLSAVSFNHGFENPRTALFLMSRLSKDYDLVAARGIKMRGGERRAMEELASCEEGSIICRVQELVGFQAFVPRSAGDDGGPGALEI